MKKFLLLISTLALLLSPAIAYAGNFAMGVTLSSNSLDTEGKEDVDSNGTIDDTKSVTDDFMVGSIFAEYTNLGDKFGITFGVDYIPFDADIDKRSITQAGIAAKGTSVVNGTNSVQGTVEDHRTIYIQPGMKFGTNSLFYATYGFVSADVNAKSVSITHTDLNETKSLDGTKLGLGIKRVADNGLVTKFDISKTEYDQISFVTSNSTTATADLDNTAISLSLGKQF
ncbi:hypothetical protein OAN68_03025 [Candidatus Pelagibacter sp.]|nr:hypothetical protein [Candidatus Pelagibacter sp.]